MPGIITAFTHLWNPLGFPYGPSNDEGIYLRRAMHVLIGQGPQESLLYDHPYFAQLFLASIFKVIGYPDSLGPSIGDVRSIEMLYLVPRILMGILAVADTFLIYKIAEIRYNRNVAFIASILFAVMPMTTWLLRRVWLEPIQMPLILSSILFAVYYAKDSARNHENSIKNENENENENENKGRRILSILLSGVFLGLAIFTKIPAFTLIPLVGFLSYQTNDRNLKAIVLWLLPVILIPLAWPMYAAYHGQLDLWLDGVLWQTHRGVQTLFYSLNYNFQIDPVLLLLGIAGLVFASIKRDLFLLLWTIPFLIFLYVIGFVSQWHFIPILPVACIAAARLIEYLFHITGNKKIRKVLPFVVVSGIAIFGLSSTAAVMMTSSDNSPYFEAVMFLVQFLHDNDKITVISNPFYSWIPLHVFHLNNEYYVDYYDDIIPIYSGKALLTVDPLMLERLAHHKAAKPIQEIYASNSTKRVAMFGGDGYNKYDKNDKVSIYLYEK
jgi:hypothetical protein